MEMEAPFDGLLTVLIALADPDLQMGGGGHPDPEIRGGRSPKKFFRPFGPHFGRKIRGGPWPLPWILHCIALG